MLIDLATKAVLQLNLHYFKKGGIYDIRSISKRDSKLNY